MSINYLNLLMCLLFSSLLINTNLFAQSNFTQNNKELKLIGYVKGNDSLRFYFSGNNHNNELIQDLIGVYTNPYAKTYQVQEEIISDLTLKADSIILFRWQDSLQTMVIHDRKNLVFNEQGKLIEIFQDYIGAKVKYKTILNYDNNLVHLKKDYYNNNKWRSHSETIYDFDENDKLKSLTVPNEKGNLVKTNFIYNNEGFLIERDGIGNLPLETKYCVYDNLELEYQNGLLKSVNIWYSNRYAPFMNEVFSYNNYGLRVTDTCLIGYLILQANYYEYNENNQVKTRYVYKEGNIKSNEPSSLESKIDFTYENNLVVHKTIERTILTEEYSIEYNKFNQPTQVYLTVHYSDTIIPKRLILELLYGDPIAVTTPELKIYPNPVKDNVTIFLQDGSYQNIDIINVSGQVVYSKHLDIQQESQTLSVKHLPNGMYFISVLHDGKRITKPILIKH